MKKTIFTLMLLISILPELCAQTGADKAFEVPENIIITRRFYVDLGKGNKMKIELSDLTDLKKVSNIDSLIQIFMQDIVPLKDSLSDPLTAKRIDYITDAQGRKKIRIQQFHLNGETFLINKNEFASLRTAQDTINLTGIILDPLKAIQKISLKNPRYYHFTFYLNDFNELSTYMNGILMEKVKTILNDFKDKWSLVLGTGFHYLKKDKTITADKPFGETASGTGDFVAANFTVNVQNYKSYFVPSFSLGLKFTFTNRERIFKWEPGLFWEPHYLFAKDNQNKLHTYRNDFLTLTYGQGGTKDYDPRKDFSFSALFSLGYVIHRSGDFFDKNTFRFGAGKVSILKTNIEPSLYFNNFFKGVSPGIRITQYF